MVVSNSRIFFPSQPVTLGDHGKPSGSLRGRDIRPVQIRFRYHRWLRPERKSFLSASLLPLGALQARLGCFIKRFLLLSELQLLAPELPPRERFIDAYAGPAQASGAADASFAYIHSEGPFR